MKPRERYLANYKSQNKIESFTIFTKGGIYLFKPFCAPDGNYTFFFKVALDKVLIPLVGKWQALTTW